MRNINAKLVDGMLETVDGDILEILTVEDAKVNKSVLLKQGTCKKLKGRKSFYFTIRRAGDICITLTY